MAELFTSWLGELVDQAGNVSPVDPNQVGSFPPPDTGETRQYVFEGNRVELLAAGSLNGRIKVTIDGIPPEKIDGCWQDSRLSPFPTFQTGRQSSRCMCSLAMIVQIAGRSRCVA